MRFVAARGVNPLRPLFMLPSTPGASLSMLILLGCLAMGMPQAARAQQDAVEFKIVHISNTLEMEADWGRGGLAAVSGLIEELHGESDKVLLTHGGQALSPSLLSYFDRGRHMIDLLNRSGTTVMGLGRGEFDFGLPVLSRRASEAYFPMLASNVVLPGGRRIEGILENWTLDYQGFTIGFYAIVDPETRDTAALGAAFISEPVAAAARQAETLRAAGADIVIGLLDADSVSRQRILQAGHSDILLGNAGAGEYGLAFASHVNGSVYAHPKREATEVVVLSVRAERRFVEMLEDSEPLDPEALLESDPASLEEMFANAVQPTEVHEEVALDISARTYSLAGYEPDAVMKAAVQSYHFSVPDALTRPVMELQQTLETDEAALRQAEHPFGNWVAEAMRQEAGADIGVVNSGYIRGSQSYERGKLLTWRSLVELLPFANRVEVLRIKGSVVESMLEHSVSLHGEGSGRFLQVAGLRVLYDLNQPVGQRVQEVMVHGERLNPHETYDVAMPSFIAAGGDGYSMFRFASEREQLGDGVFVIEALIDYLATEPPRPLQTDGRISFTN